MRCWFVLITWNPVGLRGGEDENPSQAGDPMEDPGDLLTGDAGNFPGHKGVARPA